MIANSSFKRELLLREYGINVQDIANYILTVPDRTERTRLAQLLVNLMARLNPNVRDEDNQQKLWNHLYVMTDGQLDVDAPYELSAMEYLNDKPQPMDYLLVMPKYKHYGKNVEMLIEKAAQLQDPAEREAAIISLGKLMKTLYRAYNKDNVTDDVILDNMREMSGGRLDLDPKMVESSTLFDVNVAQKPQQHSNQQNQNQGQRRYQQQDNRSGDRRHQHQHQQHLQKKKQ